ncbi:MAG: beta-N-acetylhexosaminidase [Chitinophagaceae bacterium]|nr:beta-N-acetylhexosaminidase [Chitinophagaceae bacterium]
MKKIFCFLFVLGSVVCKGQSELNIVPMPVKADINYNATNKFRITRSTLILYNSELLKPDVSYFISQVNSLFGLSLRSKMEPVDLKKEQNIKPNSIVITLLPEKYAGESGDEYYNIMSSTGNMNININNSKGLFYAIQTILQIVQKSGSGDHVLMPIASIADYPRFKYRGMHLDVGRHFFPISFVKKYIDYLAAYKFNTFHWHLTEDQGWRIEIKKYPELTKIGGWRNGTIIGRYHDKGSDNKSYGGFYTQAEIKEVVQYAKERYIDVIPEIEMPGHSSAAIAAYPWLSCFPAKPTEIPAKMISQKSIEEQKAGRIKLVQETWGVFDDVFCAGKDSTFTFLENVIDEVNTLFPSKYFHLGADECPKAHWKLCPACQKRMKDNNLKDEHELQSWFVQRIEKYLNSKGKTMIGWDEILEGGLAPNAVVMSWRGESGGIEAAKQKHPVIMTPGKPVYFDHSQSKNEDSVTIGGYNALEAVYAYEPIPKELNAEQGKFVLGAQANMWTEYMEYPSKVEYMLFPRITALSEVLWSPAAKRDWKGFERRLPTIFERLDKQKINYSKAYYDLQTNVAPSADKNSLITWKLESKNKDQEITATYTGPLRILLQQKGKGNIEMPVTHQGTYTAKMNVASNKEVIVTQNFFLNKATGKKITLATQPSKSYPGDGAFTLINGVQNEKGMSKTSEFLGFAGTDMDAMIDLKTEMDISQVTVHVLEQNGSWIYLPSQVEVTYIPDVDFTEADLKNFPSTIRKIDPLEDKGTKTITVENKQKCRYLKVKAKNYGIIPAGNPGSGNPAWLFVDEIEVL